MERICWFKEQTVIKGKHAQYMKELKEKKVFGRLYDVYLQCALYGACFDLKSEKDVSVREPQSIFTDMFSNNSEYCLNILKMVLLLDNSLNLSKEEKIKRVFSFKNGYYAEKKQMK